MQKTDFITINLLLLFSAILSIGLFTSCEGTDDSLKNVNFNFYTEQKDENTLALTLTNIVAVSEQNQSMALTEVSISINNEIFEIKPYAPSVTFDIPSTQWPAKGDFKVLVQFYSNHGTAKTEIVIYYFFSETPVLAVNHVFNGTVSCTTSWDSDKTYIAVTAPGTTTSYGEETIFYMVRTDDYTFKDETLTDDSGRRFYDEWRFEMYTDIEIDYQNTNIQDPKITIESIVWDKDKEKGDKYSLTAARAEGDTDWIAAFDGPHTVEIKYTGTGKMEGKEVKFSYTDQCVIYATPAQKPQ